MTIEEQIESLLDRMDKEHLILIALLKEKNQYGKILASVKKISKMEKTYLILKELSEKSYNNLTD